MLWIGRVGTLMTVFAILPAPAAHADNQQRVCDRLLALAEANPLLELEQKSHEPSGTVFVQGYYTVYENRETLAGRQIRIGFFVLPARLDDPAPDPMFILHGGPGAHATAFFNQQVNGWIRQKRDVVLIDQRGTGSSNRLFVRLGGNDDDLQSYFESYFEPEYYRDALPRLQRRADLTQYTTDNSVDDFNEIREALGYDTINLRGGSYGTRSALVYMRRHPETIRTASLMGIQPISFLNPLPHAREAQNSINLIFDEIRGSEIYRKAFPDLETKFLETLDRLEREPAIVTIAHPRTGEEQEIQLDRNAFAEAVRLQLYTIDRNRRLPLLLMKAQAGDFRELAKAALQQSRSVRNAIAWGMLICITESEDLSRINPDDIGPACANTFLGETRIREQMAVAEFWPSGTVSREFAEPVRVDTPVLLFSGTHDPSTAPKWGEEAARHLPNALHVIMPSGHGVFGPEVRRLEQAFLDSGTVEGLDLSEIEALKLPPLELPTGEQ